MSKGYYVLSLYASANAPAPYWQRVYNTRTAAYKNLYDLPSHITARLCYYPF